MKLGEDIYYVPARGFEETAQIVEIRLHIYWDKRAKKKVTKSSYRAEYADGFSVHFCGYELGKNVYGVTSTSNDVSQQLSFEDMRSILEVHDEKYDDPFTDDLTNDFDFFSNDSDEATKAIIDALKSDN